MHGNRFMYGILQKIINTGKALFFPFSKMLFGNKGSIRQERLKGMIFFGFWCKKWSKVGFL